MPWCNDNKPLLVLVGPTAVGKTDTAVRLAKVLDGEVVSADSRYFYRGMDIGTAKPSLAERGDVPHHLIDVSDPDHRWSLTIFQEAAKKVIAEIHARAKLPILVGGTGQFVRAVVEDWEPPSMAPDERMRTILEEWGREIGPAELHRRLGLIDPEAASRIDANNLRRTVRAFEVIFKTGIKFSQQQKKNGSPYKVLQVGLTRPREEVYARVDARIEKMIQDGFVEEVKRLIEAGYDPGLPAMSAIGYREIAMYVKGEMSLDDAIVQMKRLTRQFVRKQSNWFRDTDPNIHWFNANDLNLDDVVKLVNTALR